MRLPLFSFISATALLGGVLLLWKTSADLQPIPATLSVVDGDIYKLQVLDYQQQPLTVTYQNRWNIHDQLPLHNIPDRLQQLFIRSEDKRFFTHGGVDWSARLHALWQNLLAGRIVRGASTITEQVVRMLHPRPRTFWSRWLESFEAVQLESRFSKADILEFYLNQVPYASQRRGVVQAARYYFDRDVDTLNLKEMLALTVLVRSPGWLDPYRNPELLEKPLQRLAKKLHDHDQISDEDNQYLLADKPLALQKPRLPLQATHFVQHIYATTPTDQLQAAGRLHTTLDASLQRRVQDILDQRLGSLKARRVYNGAVLVVDHQIQAVRAWVNGGDFDPDMPGSQIDAITTPRQPGSTLKPFVYALALENGWTAATLIQDTPLAEAVGTGLHSYRNYSRFYYGALRLRDALGNSLNIPAVRAAQFVGIDVLLNRLRALGFDSLDNHPDFYGDGLALGNGEVTLLALVQAYTVLANHGELRPLRLLQSQILQTPQRLFDTETSTIIADILSDPDARRLEFGRGALLHFPLETAVKTGTSSDYRDAWAVGFNSHYTVGVWMGNLNQQSMQQISGAVGPALVLRSVFAELNRYDEDTQPLYRSPALVHFDICRDDGRPADGECAARPEWFVAGTEPTAQPLLAKVQQSVPLRLRQPAPDLQMAMDPRIPDTQEAFLLMLNDNTPLQDGTIEWLIDGDIVGVTSTPERQWPWLLQRGQHTAQVRVWLAHSEQPLLTQSVKFVVK